MPPRPPRSGGRPDDRIHESTHVITERHGDVRVASLNGDIDLPVAAQLKDDILAVVAETGGGVVLDLREVTFLDSSGLNLIFGLRRRLGRRGRRFAVVVPREERVRQVLAVVDADRIVELRETIDAALAYCRGDVDAVSLHDR